MRKITFTKMEGTGNDFVVIESSKSDLKKLAQNMCSRKTGIGADGLLVLCRSKKADYRMRIINVDGSEAEMCGNGIRCIAAYIAKNKKSKKKLFSIETIAGIIQADVRSKVPNVCLSNPKGYRPNIPITLNGRTIKVNYIDTGVPHVVIFVSNLDKINVNTIGRFIRYHRKFAPRGTNVNFVEQSKPNSIRVRTYERGVEAETYACGTGSVASAIVTRLKSPEQKNKKSKVVMKVIPTSGQILEIAFGLDKKKISDVRLKGKVNFIAKGVYYYA